MTKNIDSTKSKVFEALEALVPEQDKAKLTEAVSEFLDEAVKNIEAEFESNLNDAYATVAAEKTEDEKVAVQGYNEAYEIITDLKNRLEKQKEEFNAQLEEGYGEAYELLLAERNKNEELEVTLYEEYETKLKNVKDYIVDKVDQFMSVKEHELREMVKQEVLNDPYMLEHKLAWDKVLNIASDWLAEEDYANVNTNKLEEMKKQIDESRHYVQTLEAKNARLSIERDKLNENVRSKERVISENTEVARNEKRKSVEGKGVVEFDKNRQEVVVIKENSTKEPAVINEDTNSIESVWRKLSYNP